MLEEMVISLKTQCYGGGRGRTPMGDGLDLFLFITSFKDGAFVWVSRKKGALEPEHFSREHILEKS